MNWECRPVKARNDILEQARAIRKSTQEIVRYIPDEVALAQPSAMYDTWSGDGVAYVVEDIRLYGTNLYRCLTAHTSQADWIPDVSPSLWVRIADPAEEWPEWVQPLGSADAYAKGAKVSHNGKHWTSDVDDNVWEPGVYGWTEVAEVVE